jgi:RNA polymerase-binding transcription factor DksA
MQNATKIKTQLKQRLAELEQRLNNIEDQLDTPRSTDFAEWASETEGDEVLEKVGQTGQKEVAAIKAALDRLKAGMYGVCQKCGGTISAQRLKAVPHTAVCRNCFDR